MAEFAGCERRVLREGGGAYSETVANWASWSEFFWIDIVVGLLGRAVDVREEEWWDFHEGMSGWSPMVNGSVADQSSAGVHACASYVPVALLVGNLRI